MELSLHDTGKDSLVARIRNIDFDYQAEAWLEDLHADERITNPKRWVVRAELVDAEGLRATWSRNSGDAGRFKLTDAAPRFAGSRGAGP